MLIVIDHLTRMEHPKICVAGIAINPPVGHVRPLIPPANLQRQHLLGSGLGGLFAIGALVHLPDPRSIGEMPEVEDYSFHPSDSRFLEEMDPSTFWRLMHGSARPGLRDIFGPELRLMGERYVTEAGTGRASLGCLTPEHKPRIYLDNRQRVRVSLIDEGASIDLSVSDLRVWDERHTCPRQRLVRRLQQRIDEGDGVLLSVGLTRPFARHEGDAARHYVQVNNIHLQSKPIWN